MEQEVNIAILNDVNVSVKEVEKLSKYNDIAVLCTWNTRALVILIRVAALGSAPLSHQKYLNELPGSANSLRVQKITLLATVHIL